MGIAGIPERRIREDDVVVKSRNRFKNVMRQLKAQNNYLKDDDDGDEDEEMDLLNSSDSGLMGYHNQRGSSHLHGRKKAKVEARDGGLGNSSSSAQFVMRLFDRSVDLSQFGESTPMYSMARAWLKNKPECSSHPEGKEKEGEELEQNLLQLEINELSSTTSEEIHNLPPPVPLSPDRFGNPVSLRIPAPPAKENEPFYIYYEDEMAPSPAILFQNHLDRWNHIRQQWKLASAYNEQRYEESANILRQARRKW